jgi:hypothetical protein
MRVTVAHQKTKEEVKRAVDLSFDDLFKGVAGLPLTLSDERRTWAGDVLTFSFVARVGFLANPMSGTVIVTNTDLTIDADLGFLEKLIASRTVTTAIENRVKGLLT